jgi:hypothetical protein
MAGNLTIAKIDESTLNNSTSKSRVAFLAGVCCLSTAGVLLSTRQYVPAMGFFAAASIWFVVGYKRRAPKP